MTAIDKFKKLFDKLTEQRGDQWLEKIPAWLGDHAGMVSTGTAGLIFVRTVEGQVLTVFNNIAPSEYNILVKIGRSKDQPHLWQVIERREVWSVPASSSVVHHHQQHMFLAPDMVPIDRKQVLALTVLVSDPANFIVRVYGSVVHTATGIRKIDTQDIDLSSYVVTGGAKFVSIESDDDGVLTVHEGTAFDAPEIGTYADVPVPDPGEYLIAFVLLYDGQSQLSNNDIRVPFPLGVIAKGSGLQIDEAAADTPADGDKFGFWDIVDDALKSITWANIKTTLKTYFDTLYSVLGHTHTAPDAADVTYTPADLTDWTGSADPGDVDQALDQLADRVTAGGGGLPNPFALTADISPAALTADVDDYNPTGLSTADVIRITTDGADYAINGLAGGADGRIIIVENITSGNRLTIPDEALTSAAANRFELNGDTLQVFPKKSATFIYDATVSRWCPLAIGDSLTLRGVPISAGLPGIITDTDILVYNAGDDVFEPKSPAEYMVYLEELIADLVGGMFSGNTETGITATYQDADNTIDLEAAFSDAEGDPAAIGTAADGTSAYPARRDHVHAISNSSAVLGSIFSITGTAGTYQDTGLSVTLPSAGTYKITADVRAELKGNAGALWWIHCKFYNSTDAADVTDSERMIVLISTTAVDLQNTAPMSKIVTVAASKVIKLYAARNGTGSPSWTVSNIASDTNGKTEMMCVKIG